MEPLFPALAPKPPTEPTVKAAPATIDTSVKTDPPVATIERFDSSGAVVVIRCPGGMATIDAEKNCGSLKLDTPEKVARMVNAGLVYVFNMGPKAKLEKDPNKDVLKLPEVDALHVSKDIMTPQLTFGVNGKKETARIASRAELAGALGKLMALVGGSLTAEPVDATAPGALAAVTVSVPRPVVIPAPAAPTAQPPATRPPLRLSGGTGSAATNPQPVVSVPVVAVPVVAVPVVPAAAPTPVPSVAASDTQRVKVSTVMVPTPAVEMTADSLKLETGLIFRSGSGADRVVILNREGTAASVFRRATETSKWERQDIDPNVETLRASFAEHMRGGAATLQPTRLNGVALLNLQAQCS